MNQRDWNILRGMRGGFLTAREGLEDYWDKPVKLELYDRYFATRIGWKWDAVLAALRQRGWQPPQATVVDWGCGTGVAARRFLEAYPGTAKVNFLDRSQAARRFAADRLKAEFPRAEVVQSLDGTWLLSHVLNELPAASLETLLGQLEQSAQAIIWIEPGTHEVSRRLGEVRERLRGRFRLVAPCSHQERCGMLTPENARHWCHHFAAPPSAIFQDREWSDFSRELEIDLRSLPYAHLVLDRLPVVPAEEERTIGRARLYKGFAKLLTCTAAGVSEKTLQKRDDPALFRQLKKG